MMFINVKKCLKEPQQYLKLIALIICVCFTIYQLSGCVNKMMHPPVSTYYKFSLNDTLTYPSLTVCRKPAYKNYLFPKYGLSTFANFLHYRIFQTFKFDNYTIDEFLEDTTYKFNEILPTLAYSGYALDPNRLNVKSSYILEYGRCYTLIPKVPSSIFSIDGGYFLYMIHSSARKLRDQRGISTSGFQIFLHDDNEILAYEDDQQNSFLESLYVETEEDMKVVLKVQKYSQISTADDPCNPNKNYSKSRCQEECYHLQIAKKVGCVTPWLRLPENETFPTCSDFDSLNYLITGFSQVNRSLYMSNCQCLTSCDISVYSTHIVSRRQISTYESNLYVYYSSNLITTMNEVISYDWNIFMSDIGGSVGFLLGLSVIGLISAIEKICQIVIKKFFKAKNKKLKEQSKEIKENNVDKKEDQNGQNNEYLNIMEYLGNCEYLKKNSITEDGNKY